MAVPGQVHVARCVDAAKARDELAMGEATFDPVGCHGACDQLASSNHPRLCVHKGGNQEIRMNFVELWVLGTQKCTNLRRERDERVELRGVRRGHARKRRAGTCAGTSARACRDTRATAPRRPYSGMLPCLRLGWATRLVSSVSSAVITLGRVSCGTITSSM